MNRAPAIGPEQPLFSHLPASRPPRQRRGVWLLAMLLHVPVIVLAWFSDAGLALRTEMEEAIVPLLLEDAPRPIERPRESKPSGIVVRKEVAPVMPATMPKTLSSDQVNEGMNARADVASIASSRSLRETTLRERLGPGAARDAQVFAPIERSAPVSPTEIARARISERLRPFNDSLIAEQRAVAGADDWVRVDSKGNRWGVSRDGDSLKVHLGGVTVPLYQSKLVGSLEKRDQLNARLRAFEASEHSANRAATKEVFDARVEVIRNRKSGVPPAAAKKPVT